MNENLKPFHTIICFLMFFFSYQIAYAQQPVAQQASTKGFVKLGMPLEEALTKITFIVPWLSGDSYDEVVFQGEGITHHAGRIEWREDEEQWFSSFTLLTRRAVEGNRYIFVPISKSGEAQVFFDLSTQ